MSINEQMVQDIVQDVLAKMQIASDVQGDRGVFKDMNEAIEAAKASQKIVAEMSLDHREKVISNIRKKIMGMVIACLRKACIVMNRISMTWY